MKQDRTILVRIHPDLAKAVMNLAGDDLMGVGLDNPTVAAQQVESKQVRDRSAVGETPSLYPARTPVSDLPAELGKEPRLADAGFADKADRLAMAVFDLAEEIVQN